MITYRRTRASDRVKVRELYESKGLCYDGREPLVGFVAVGDNDELIGVSYVHRAAIIEPFICETPIPAMKLFYMTEGVISQLECTSIIAQVNKDNERLVKELPRIGLKKVDDQYIIFRKPV